MGSHHEQPQLHTDVKSLLEGKILEMLFKLCAEVCTFFKEHLHPQTTLFKNPGWIVYLAYLANVFSKLIKFNFSLQGKDN